MNILKDFIDGDSALRVVLYQAESGQYAFRTYYNNIPINLALYEFGKPFLKKLQAEIQDFLNEA